MVVHTPPIDNQNLETKTHNMIDVKTLRINNLVCDGNSFPMTVVGVFKDMAYLNFEGNEGDMLEVADKDLEPIPLTEEWLVKLSFEKFQSALITSYHKIIKCTYAELEELSICKNDEGTWYVYFRQGSQTDRDNYHLNDLVQLSNKMKYVHQLQNLASALTGTELKANH